MLCCCCREWSFGLYQEGCPWTSQAVFEAIAMEEFDCADYLIDNGCPWKGLFRKLAKKVWYPDMKDLNWSKIDKRTW